MPIRQVEDPEAARALATSLLENRFPGGGGGSRPLVEGAAPEPPVIGAIEVYNLTPRELVDGRTDDPTPTGWRYVQLRNGAREGEVVDVLAHNREAPTLASYAAGRMAGRLGEAATRAQEELAGDEHDYEPRVLRVPEIHMEALWMHSPDPQVADRFYGLPKAQSDLTDGRFLEAAMDRARSYMEAVAAAGRSVDPGEPGGGRSEAAGSDGDGSEGGKDKGGASAA